MGGKIIVTRPIDQGRDFAGQIVSQIDGIKYEDIIFEPMLNIVPIDVEFVNSEIFDGVIVTSVNVIHVIEKNPDLKRLPFYCVGNKTAQELENIGVKHIEGVVETSCDLLPVVNNSDSKDLLYLRGKDISFDLAVNLKNSGITVAEEVCYEAKKIDRFSDDFLRNISNNNNCLVTLFSRRTAENFIKLLANLNEKNTVDFKKIHILCISDSVLKCLGIENIQSCVSDTPDVNGMLKLLEDCSAKVLVRLVRTDSGL